MRKPSKLSPRISRPVKKAGHPTFVPTDEQRATVKLMAGYRIPQDEMVLLVLNPETKRPIAEDTLRKAFKEELRVGFTTQRMRIMAATFRSAIGDADHPGNVTAQIWLGKCLYGLRETTNLAVISDSDEGDMLDWGRRIAYTLHKARQAAKRQQGVVKPEKT